MAAWGSKDFVAAAAGLGALGLGAFLCLRARGALDSRWSDGERDFESTSSAAVRYAVWDRAEKWSALGDATDPALASDGRLLVFASGSRGLNSELFVCELVDGRPSEPRALLELNTPADELAPAFGPGALYFASDRPGGAGGLDVWRAPYSQGQFGKVERLAPGLNSAADETDPAPVPGTLRMLFASNRARPDFDLYAAGPDASGFYLPEPLAALNTPAEERGPAFSSDPRSLTFSSDRAGSFDLYRALRVHDGWGPPRLVPELSTPRNEGAPELAADGFALWFAGEGEDGVRTLWRARSRELFRVPPPPVTLAQWLTLAALLLLALLALLAKRWHALDILYQCLLVSLILHFLLLLYLRTVIPDERSYEAGEARQPSFRVRMAPEPEAPRQGDAARGLTGPLAPARAPLASEPARAEPAPTASVAAPAPKAEPGPARQASLIPDTSPAPGPPLAAAAEALERYRAEAPSLALEGRASTFIAPSTRTTAELARPERVQGASARLARLAPAGAEIAAVEAGVAAAQAGVAREARLERGPVTRPSPDLSAPDERFERPAERAPALALDSPTAVVRSQVAASQPRHEAFEPARSPPATPVRNAGEVASVPLAASAEAPDSPARASLPMAGPPGQSSAQAWPEAALRTPSLEAVPAAAPRATPFAATDGRLSPEFLSATAPPRPARGADGPTRTSHAGPDSNSALLAVSPSAAALAPAAPDLTAAPTIERLRANPLDDAPSLAAAPALRALAAERAEESAARLEPKNPFDPLTSLDPTPQPTHAAPSAPERARANVPASPAPARPEARALAVEVPVPAPHEAAFDQASPPRLAATPYQNRFGAQKLRALEEFGGTAGSEHAVAAGLAYLASIQGANGAWGQRSDEHSKYLDVRIGKSALALLAFLGAGHVPGGDTQYAARVERAVSFLVEAQAPATGHFGRSCSYGHGIATYALAECFALTHDERLRVPLAGAVREILRHQSEQRDARFFGGWGYYFADGHVWNGDEWPRTSVTAWQVMALESARLGGLEVPDSSFSAAREFLLATWDARAQAFRYDHDPSRLSSGYPILPASTPAALFALSLLGIDTGASALGPARRFVLTRAPDGYRYSGDDDFVRHARGNLYFWYYATLALFRVGGVEWERWNSALLATLLPAQDADGSWRPLDTYSEYAGDEDDERAYTTALCVLSLEVYYRYFTPLLKVR